MITAKLVKELRDKTGAGMLDCKKALEATDGNVDAAIDYLREKGIAKAAKKSDRIAAEGLCNAIVEGNEALLFELNSETDFVAQNKQFLDLIEEVGQALLTAKVDNTEAALQVDNNGQTVEMTLQAATAKIGEKFTLRRVTRVVKTDDQVFGFYKHMGGRIESLVLLNGGNDVVAKDIAMHVAAQNPKYLDRNAVDPDVLEHEKKVLTQQALEEGKPANIVDKMVIGRVNKFLKDICLVDQPFVKDPDQTVTQYLKANNASVVSFVRLEVGEGIEKKEEDFVQEVMNQARQQK
jgi:elongation factor Ts